MGEGLEFAFVCFFIPIFSVFLTMFMGESIYKKKFKSFTIFIVVISILAFVVLTFLAALGRSFNH